MPAFLKPHEGRIYAALRIVAGFLFLCHGAQKVLGVFGGPHPDLPTAMVWAAGLIELVGGALVALGFHTRWAASASRIPGGSSRAPGIPPAA